MRRDDVPDDLERLAFDFFYWFSRFEFALKENGYLRNKDIGAKAEPDWQEFVDRWKADYEPSAAAAELIALNPERQIVGATGLEFRSVGFNDKPSELGKVVRLVSTVRNNLFHGGKHSYNSWDNPDRMQTLLTLVIKILGEFAMRADIEHDFQRYY